jgi:hypothetical protein
VIGAARIMDGRPGDVLAHVPTGAAQPSHAAVSAYASRRWEQARCTSLERLMLTSTGEPTAPDVGTRPRPGAYAPIGWGHGGS